MGADWFPRALIMARHGDDDEPFVRPFGLTGGRTVPSRSDLDLTTQVKVAAGADQQARAGHRHLLAMSPEMQTIMDLAPRPIAIAELAARMALPLTTVQILVSDLVDDGRLTISLGLQAADTHGQTRLDFLQRVRDGLINA
ncbi:DUF742 domain-containing protein [Kibdelosporangium aridum]|uniref:DUF742 domain-containing protein n=1 Tax=Kibdelosporangium aridum TaxID=2030 RepID=A0A1W2FSF8_KIBAR|nr:DUF742 domain-containing protein [Kibdelosporangium aridum]SMD24662.1 Protein of unknown function [Kibdelosporangium aridum]